MSSPYRKATAVTAKHERFEDACCTSMHFFILVTNEELFLYLISKITETSFKGDEFIFVMF